MLDVHPFFASCPALYPGSCILSLDLFLASAPGLIYNNRNEASMNMPVGMHPERPMQRRFLADAMLGSLAKWLRALGYDTYYQNHYEKGGIERLLSKGRLLLSRNRKTVALHPCSVLIRSERLTDQILEMRSAGLIQMTQGWFTRCLICNVLLEKADPLDSRQNVPEYVFHEKADGISRCPSCGRYFWPGTHRERMIKQLREWGFHNP